MGWLAALAGQEGMHGQWLPAKKPILLWMLGGFSILLLISPSLLPYLIK